MNKKGPRPLKISGRHPLEVRPISARPLKSVLDTLRPYCPQSVVLDLFAGHGRLGIGALAEGATSATFVESHRATLDQKKNAGHYISQCSFVAMDVFKFLPAEAAHQKQYDIVFADPPFALWEKGFENELFVAVQPVLTEGAIFVVKHPVRMVIFSPVFGFSIWKSTPFGESGLTYFRYGSSKENTQKS